MSDTVQVTFHLTSGEHESFSVPIASKAFFQQLQVALNAPLLVFQLPDQTVCIKPDAIAKVEIEPPCTGITGTFLFANSDRVTPMTRSGWKK